MRLSWLLLLFMIIGSFAPHASQSAPPATPEATADWPQLQYDAQRTGAAPQPVAGPYRFYWRWNAVPLASRIQPVVAANRLFIGSINGTMYALDADQDANGNTPSVLWSRDLGSPIRAGAAVVGDTVIVGTRLGDIYGLDAANGQVRWIFPTGAAITAAPLVTSDTAYLGTSGGVLYALAVADGALRWNYRAGWPILSAAALSADGTTVLFAAEDIAAYGLDATTGQFKWRTPLHGQSTADRWPVVAGATVVFRTQPLRHFHDLLIIGDTVMDQAGPEPGRPCNWNADWAGVSQQIRTHLTAKPDQQTFFALNTSTGTSRGVAPVLYTFSTNDTPAAPVVRNGMYITFLRSRCGIQNDSPNAVHIASKYDADLATLDPVTLQAGEIRASNAFNYQWRSTSDEGANLSLAGSLLLINNWERFGAINLANGVQTGIAQVAHNYPECGSQCQSNNALLPFFPNPQTPAGPRRAEGHTRTGAVVASGRMFWRVLQGGLASVGPISGAQVPEATAQAADGTERVPTPDVAALPAVLLGQREDAPLMGEAADFSSYVTTMPVRPVAQPPADLVQRLEEEVRRVIKANNHLLPVFMERGIATSGGWPPDTSNPSSGDPLTRIRHVSTVLTGNAYWYDPGELVYSLSLAYPYLSSSTKAQLSTYLKQAMQRYDPLSPLPFENPARWMFNGTSRVGYTVPWPSEINIWPPPRPPLQTLYALWAYAEYTGDWAYLAPRWPAIKSFFDDRKGTVDSYARIAGVIGYYRIAQHFNKPTEAAEALAIAQTALTSGLDFAAFRTRANQLYPDIGIDFSNNPLGDPNRQVTNGVRGQVFFGLTPEVGRFLREQVQAAAGNEITLRTTAPGGGTWLDGGALLWYATRAGAQGIEPSAENSYHGPDLAWGLFLARAYAEGVNRTTLRSQLDRPWGIGDPWYLQKLVATIEAIDGPLGSAPTLNGIQVESFSFNQAVIRWSTNIPASGWIEYGKTAGLGSSSPIWLDAVEQHRIALEGLIPETTYFYRVCSTAPGGKTCSATQSLVTSQAKLVFLPGITRP